MKEYRLIDYYENYGLVGEYNTFEEVKAAADEHISETDGECDLQCYRLCNRCGQYHCEVIL